MKIGEAAQVARVGVETIRFYERRGLIEQPEKPYGGFRTYPSETIDRIRFIRKAQEIGFSLHDISELLTLRVDPVADCAATRGLARAKLEQVNRKIVSLQTMKAALEVLIQNCPGQGAISKCSIIDALTVANESVELT